MDTTSDLDFVVRPLADAEVRAEFLDRFEDYLTGFSAQDPPAPGSVFIRDFDPAYRDEGLDWPTHALTMVGRRRLHNFRTLIERVVAEDVPGDIIETGVWRGGASILARAVLGALGVTDRKVIVADSFEGLPAPDLEKYPADAASLLHEHAELAISLEQVQSNFAQFGLLDEQVVFVKGWFRETMKSVPSTTLAVMRLDGDMYESTVDPLNELYDRLSPGGWVIIDDYYLVDGCKLATNEFIAARRLNVQLEPIDRVGCCFQKPTV